MLSVVFELVNFTCLAKREINLGGGGNDIKTIPNSNLTLTLNSLISSCP